MFLPFLLKEEIGALISACEFCKNVFACLCPRRGAKKAWIIECDESNRRFSLLDFALKRPSLRICYPLVSLTALSLTGPQTEKESLVFSMGARPARPLLGSAALAEYYTYICICGKCKIRFPFILGFNIWIMSRLTIFLWHCIINSVGKMIKE